MEEDVQENKPSGSVLIRHRSPTFSRDEVKALLNIVNKYKLIVFNKSTTSAASRAKELTWSKIAKIFNSQGFQYSRNAESLKMKLENLKRDMKRVSKNLMDGIDESDDLLAQLMAMMCEAENNTSIVDDPVESDQELNDTEGHKDKSNGSHWNGNFTEDRNSDESDDGDSDNKRLVNRSLNFSPQECNLLLQCVRQEKHEIFSKSTSTGALKLKNSAWSRVTNSFNKLSPQKRSTKVLRTKFTNMKRMTRKASFKGYFQDFGKKKDKQEDSDKFQKIKSEPPFGFGDDPELDQDDNVDDPDDQMETSHKPDDLMTSLDPLNTVLSSDSGISSFNMSENKEVVKLKLELLNYELETAKLQRKRIEDLAKAEAAEREAKAIESSLRLRAARLEVISAEMRLPPTHHALTYTPQESRAEHYILQYHVT